MMDDIGCRKFLRDGRDHFRLVAAHGTARTFFQFEDFHVGISQSVLQPGDFTQGKLEFGFKMSIFWSGSGTTGSTAISADSKGIVLHFNRCQLLGIFFGFLFECCDPALGFFMDHCQCDKLVCASTASIVFHAEFCDLRLEIVNDGLIEYRQWEQPVRVAADDPGWRSSVRVRRWRGRKLQYWKGRPGRPHSTTGWNTAIATGCFQ